MEFSKDKFLPKGKLEMGAFYLAKDGRILGYLGFTEQGEFVFVDSISVLILEPWTNEPVTIKNEKVLAQALKSAIRAMISNPNELDKWSIAKYKTLPKLYGKLDYLPTIFDTVKFTEIVNSSVKIQRVAPTLEELGYVTEKDLVVGRMYGDYRNWHIYLGKNGKGKFCWMYVGDPERLRDEPRYIEKYTVWEYDNDIQATKQIKKIKPTEGFENFCADLSKLPLKTKQMIYDAVGINVGGFDPNKSGNASSGVRTSFF